MKKDDANRAKLEIERLREKIVEAALRNPKKAAKILTFWLIDYKKSQKTYKKAA